MSEFMRVENITVQPRRTIVGKLRRMQIGDYFEIEEWQRNKIYQSAKHAKIKIRTQKISDGVVAVIRTK